MMIFTHQSNGYLMTKQKYYSVLVLFAVIAIISFVISINTSGVITFNISGVITFAAIQDIKREKKGKIKKRNMWQEMFMIVIVVVTVVETLLLSSCCSGTGSKHKVKCTYIMLVARFNMI